ncbi:MAG: TadA family conjugal transfer-associated ATPase [Geodermatophilaceae bacterium]|nr:TadA family conjugal transfer-associated ATPase [Geodermatophilaceae bacterium]MDQ3465053.1 TadA family conjugal transfer-associated ATPase [Actinomycetota bacterium]
MDPTTADVTTPIVDRVRRRLASSGLSPSRPAVAGFVRAESGGLLTDAHLLQLVREAEDEMSGAGAVEPLLRDPEVTDVLVNGPEEVWIDRGSGLERAAVRFADDAAVRRLAARLAAAAGRRLDDSAPWVDASLPDGTRLHAILPPVSVGATRLSLRVLRPRAFGMDDLIVAGTVTEQSRMLLTDIVRGRLAFLVSGGTGSGKTTLLSTLLGLVDPAERIVLVEDAAELRPRHPHVVRLVARPPNVEGTGQVSLQDLVRQALRMRPDRLIVGETRGAEVADLLAALNTGHDGGAGTVHANSAAEVPTRMEALGALAGLSRDAIQGQLVAAVDAVIHLRRDRAGVRRVHEIGLLRRDGDGVTVLPAWRRDGAECEAGPRLRALLAERVEATW